MWVALTGGVCCCQDPTVRPFRGDIRWARFPDTFPNLFIDKPHRTVRGKHLAFFASFFHPETMFAQLSGRLVSWEQSLECNSGGSMVWLMTDSRMQCFIICRGTARDP